MVARVFTEREAFTLLTTVYDISQGESLLLRPVGAHGGSDRGAGGTVTALGAEGGREEARRGRVSTVLGPRQDGDPWPCGGKGFQAASPSLSAPEGEPKGT